MNRLTTLDMEVALMQKLGIRRALIVPNVSYGITELGHECDLLSITPSGYATEVEIKISKADLMKDKDKRHGHHSLLLKYLYFAVPETLQEDALAEIPERAGLYVVRRTRNKYRDYDVVKVRSAEENTAAHKWKPAQMNKLAELGAMRILGLKKKVLALKQKE